MSAFAGVLRLDGRAATPSQARSMLERLRHRVDDAGWNAASCRASGPLALAYAPLASTPQARWERAHPEEATTREGDGRRLAFAGHVRLDNRAEIARACGLEPSEAQGWSDGRLVLEAVARWNDEAPQHLRGDFAFAVWDEGSGRLLCARDRFGVRPFYFAFVPGRLFAFANEIKALWALEELCPRVNRESALSYLLARHYSKESTFYEGVERLPPATRLVVEVASPSSLFKTRYWHLDATREERLSDGEATERVRQAFDASVGERTRTEGPFALFLSGGLDSSSIAATAPLLAPDKTPVRAISTVFARFPECDERRWIEQTLEHSRGALTREWLWGDDVAALHDIEHVLWHLDAPPAGPNTASAWTQYAPLHSAKTHVVLDGHGGDEVVFLGYGRIAELLRAGRYTTAQRELALLRRHGVVDLAFWPLLWPVLVRRARGTRGLGRLLALSRTFSSNLAPPPPAGEDEMEAPIMALLHPTMRESIEAQLFLAPPRDVRQDHAQTLDSPLQTLALEGMDAMAGAHAVEVRSPFWEPRLAQLCLSLPSDQKMRNGFNRFVMRRAMQERLTNEVAWRMGKTNFAPQMIAGLHTIERKRIQSLLNRWTREGSPLEEFLSLQRLSALWHALDPAQSEAPVHAMTLWRALCLGLWLERATHKMPRFEKQR